MPVEDEILVRRHGVPAAHSFEDLAAQFRKEIYGVSAKPFKQLDIDGAVGIVRVNHWAGAVDHHLDALAAEYGKDGTDRRGARKVVKHQRQRIREIAAANRGWNRKIRELLFQNHERQIETKLLENRSRPR